MILALALTISGVVTVQLSAHVKVRGTSISLGEVAQIAGSDPRLVEQLQAFELGNIPAPGYSRVFQAAQLKRDLLHMFPGLDLRFTGEAAARIEPALQVIGKDSIRAAALVTAWIPLAQLRATV